MSLALNHRLMASEASGLSSNNLRFLKRPEGCVLRSPGEAGAASESWQIRDGLEQSDDFAVIIEVDGIGGRNFR